MRDKILLRQLQALPLDAKILMTQQRIREWYDHWFGDVVISFSGGKDSTVLAHLVHDMYPDVPMVFANTGLEYPEIQAFARKMGAEFVRPKMSFSEVISTYGYPIISKEVAEAIHFARRIVPENTDLYRGGYNSNGNSEKQISHRERSQAGLCGKRDDTERMARRAEIRWGGYKDGPSRTDRLETCKPHGQDSATKEQRGSRRGTRKSASGEQTSMATDRIPPPSREIRRINRFRRQLMGKD